MTEDLELRRMRERTTMTIAQSAARGDRLRLKCLDCERVKIVPAQQLVARHGDRIIADLTPRCDECFRRRRKGTGLHRPGYGTYLQIRAPGDPEYDSRN